MKLIKGIVGLLLTTAALFMWMGPMMLGYPATGWPAVVALGGILLVFPATYFLYEGWFK